MLCGSLSSHDKFSPVKEIDSGPLSLYSKRNSLELYYRSNSQLSVGNLLHYRYNMLHDSREVVNAIFRAIRTGLDDSREVVTAIFRAIRTGLPKEMTPPAIINYKTF